jgi:2-oxoglutarate ferredoxin oxidoreductase subunit beta
MNLSQEWGDRIPLGVIYENDRPSFEERLGQHSLVRQPVERKTLKKIVESYS